MHKLLLEDALDTSHRPKVEEYDHHIFLTLKMISIEAVDGQEEIDEEQVSFILGSNWLVSFQEEEGDVFDALRKRMRLEGSQIRKSKMDYLFYRLVDTVVDHYFIVSEHISDEIENIEEELINGTNESIRWRIQTLRKDLIQIRKVVAPLREAVGRLSKEPDQFITKSTTRYLHDVYEHIIQLNDYIDTQRDMLSSLGDLYLSGISHKMNQIMKVLTIIATIFIPLTFIAGIYGMNFAHMPELDWEYGYAGVWILMIIVTGFMVYYFKKKDWL
jgi:magnesium transporter